MIEISNATRMMHKAAALARLFLDETVRLQQTPLKDAPLMSWVPLLSLPEGGSVEAVTPKINQILLYGSVARDEQDPHDIDMMIVDNGHFSPHFVSNIRDAADGTWPFSPGDIPYIGGNLSEFVSMFFGYEGGESDERLQNILQRTHVDLHVFPQDLFTKKDFRDEMSRKMCDSRFLHNIVRDAMVYRDGWFVPVTIEELEAKYTCDLSDLH